MWIFKAALFIQIQNWRQATCLLTDEWIIKLCYICTMEYYSAVKNLIQGTTCMNIKHIMFFKAYNVKFYYIHRAVCPSLQSLLEHWSMCLPSHQKNWDHLVVIFHQISEKAMAPHSSTLAWKIPWMEEPGRLQSMGSRRVGHNWATSLSLFTFMHWRRKWQPTPVFLPGESQGWRSLVGCHLSGRTESDMTEAT